MASFFERTSLSRSTPSDATFLVKSSAVSSNEMTTPGSPSAMPLMMNCRPNSVLPQPGPPQIKVARPRGKPPSVTVSKPSIPVSAFFSGESVRAFTDLRWTLRINPERPFSTVRKVCSVRANCPRRTLPDGLLIRQSTWRSATVLRDAAWILRPRPQAAWWGCRFAARPAEANGRNSVASAGRTRPLCQGVIGARAASIEQQCRVVASETTPCCAPAGYSARRHAHTKSLHDALHLSAVPARPAPAPKPFRDVPDDALPRRRAAGAHRAGRSVLRAARQRGSDHHGRHRALCERQRVRAHPGAVERGAGQRLQ